MSSDTPLLSNLNVWENMALIKQYQQNFSKKDAKTLAIQYLRQLNLESIANTRNPDLKEEERFCGLLLRAAMVNDAVILIYKPFKLLPAMKDSTFIHNILINMDTLYTQCYIFDYTWNKNRYRMNDAEEYCV